MDHPLLAAELLRVLRGRRSRPAFSRLLGYRSNVVQRWENQQAWPTATAFCAICERRGIDMSTAVETFLRRRPKWLKRANWKQRQVVAELLQTLRGTTPIQVLAERTGFSRFQLNRWLTGQADPRLPQLLAVIDGATRRLPDFVATLADPSLLPSLAKLWSQLETARELAYTEPLTHVVLRALELASTRGRGRAQVHSLCRATGTSEPQVREALDRLVETGQVKKLNGRYRLVSVQAVDTSTDPRRSQPLKLRWTRLALERLEADSPGFVGYSLFAVSRADLLAIKALQQACARQIQTRIDASTDSQCVGLYCVQLLDLGESAGNVFAKAASPR